MPPKRKRTAAKDKKIASPLRKNKGKKTEEKPEHSLCENATQDKSIHGDDSNIDKKTPPELPQQSTTEETEILISPEGRLLWLLRHRHLYTREGDNNPTAGLGLAAITDTDDTDDDDSFEPVGYIPIIKPYAMQKKDLEHMEKTLLCEDGIRNSVACLVTLNKKVV